jgi:hypothetical protein
LKSIEEHEDTPSIPFIQVGNIKPQGDLSDERVRTFPKAPEASSKAGFACPGDILVTVAGTLGKVHLVSENYDDGLYYDTSVRRVRVDEDIVDPEVVYEFLKSEVARTQIERYASGSVIPMISSADLGNIRVFLPPSRVKGLQEAGVVDEDVIEPQKSFREVIADMLLAEVVNPLRSMEGEATSNWRTQAVESLQQITKQIQRDHEPLDELVIREYPLPIALAYRRMIRAVHNPYEQVGRLVELYEALAQFFYYVLLSDYLRNPVFQEVFYPKDKGVRTAYKNFSMASRLKFIDGFLKAVKEHATADSDLQLFIPELLDVDLYTPLDDFRELRNEDAHSAAGTPSAQRAILQENRPSIEALLDQVRFLRGYPLCRVQSSYGKRGKVILRIEYFQGALYETDIREQEAPLTESGQPKQILADAEHVVLLNSQFDWLDLHPFYQIINSEEYQYEAHMCFHKQTKKNQLLGESIQFRKEFPLPGIKDLQRLTGQVS